jgi:hypothetical protein
LLRTKPLLTEKLYMLFMNLPLRVGGVLSMLLMGIIYLILLTPMGLMMRLFGFDPLMKKNQPESTTYLVPRTELNIPLQHERPF